MSNQRGFCSHCGAKLVDGASFCEACGKPVAAIVSPNAATKFPPPPLPAPRSDSTNWMPILFGCGAGVIILVLGCAIAWGLSQVGSSSLATSTVQAQPAATMVRTQTAIASDYATIVSTNAQASAMAIAQATLAAQAQAIVQATGAAKALATPSAIPTPTGTPTFGKITIAENVTDAGEIINPRSTFPAGTKKVWAYFTYLNMKNGDAWGRKWLRDGAVVLEKNEIWDRGANGWFSAYYDMPDGSALPSGTFDFVLYIGGEVVQNAAL